VSVPTLAGHALIKIYNQL